MPSGSPILDRPVRLDGADRARAKRRALYVTFTVVVTGLLVMAVLETIIGFRGVGLDSDTRVARNDGTVLSVEFATVTRGELDSPLVATIEDAHGFGDDVTIAVSSRYLELFRNGGVSPQPSSETATGDSIVMTFDPPPAGRPMRISWDLAARPVGWFTTQPGSIAVLDGDGSRVVSVAFETSVRP